MGPGLSLRHTMQFVTKPALLSSASLPLRSCLCLVTQARVGKEPWLKEKLLPLEFNLGGPSAACQGCLSRIPQPSGPPDQH